MELASGTKIELASSPSRDETGQVAEGTRFSNIQSLRSGCCKPPTECGYVYVNETIWTSSGSVIYDMDCLLWSNNQERLCYDCDSCKAGILGSLKKSWRKVSVINIVVLIILVIFYVIGCAAFRNNKLNL